MTNTPLASTLALALVLTSATGSAADPGSETHELTPVAGIAFGLESPGRVETVSGQVRSLESPALLRQGDRVSAVDGDGRVVLLNGTQYRLTAPCTVRLADGALTVLEGEARELEAVERLPVLAPLIRDGEHSRRVGAHRIRGSEHPEAVRMAPCDAESISARSAELRFEDPAGREPIRLEVEDLDGRSVLQVAAPRSPVELEGAALEAGKTYFWRVVFADQGGEKASRRAIFTTWTEEQDAALADVAALLGGEVAALLELLFEAESP